MIRCFYKGEALSYGFEREYKQKGLKFTMDDIAKDMSVSKKTIYQVIDDKNALINDLVDYCFASIKEREEEVKNDLSHTTLERIQMILAAMPEKFFFYKWI